MLLFPPLQPHHYGAALKIERKMSHFNIAFDRYASIGTVMHYILVISKPGRGSNAATPTALLLR